MRILHRYTAFLWFEQLCLRIRLIFAMVYAESHEGSDLFGSLISFVCSNVYDTWTVSRIRSWMFHVVLFRSELLVIIGHSRRFDLEGSVDFLFCASCSVLLDCLEDPIFRLPLSPISEWAARYSPSDLTSEVSCWYSYSNIFILVE